ncbi:unnamed protein product, partial [Pelagomonas calceolata]
MPCFACLICCFSITISACNFDFSAVFLAALAPFLAPWVTDSQKDFFCWGGSASAMVARRACAVVVICVVRATPLAQAVESLSCGEALATQGVPAAKTTCGTVTTAVASKRTSQRVVMSADVAQMRNFPN